MIVSISIDNLVFNFSEDVDSQRRVSSVVEKRDSSGEKKGSNKMIKIKEKNIFSGFFRISDVNVYGESSGCDYGNEDTDVGDAIGNDNLFDDFDSALLVLRDYRQLTLLRLPAVFHLEQLDPHVGRDVEDQT